MEQFGVLIVGSGIIGTATARDAATQGSYRPSVEKNDSRSGTSSRSTQLIRRGIHHLECRKAPIGEPPAPPAAWLLRRCMYNCLAITAERDSAWRSPGLGKPASD